MTMINIGIFNYKKMSKIALFEVPKAILSHEI